MPLRQSLDTQFATMINLHNIQDGEVVHQRCVLITGQCADDAKSSDDFIEIETKGHGDNTSFPAQRWPLCQGWFKALALLNPGDNFIRITVGAPKDSSYSKQIRLQYIPLLQTPPLHLAIMVAKDSPLLIDCPARKFGALSGAHSSLDSAIAKLRLSAYMWQALTAEELRSNGLGRRSFRLEEEWAADTLSQEFVRDTTMQSTAKVHLIRTEKTVKELRDVQIAQQNHSGSRRDELHEIFSKALRDHGGPFTSEAKPVVAGLILDSKYDSRKNMILAHAALGAHNPNGLSLGIFGSHLTYSWPRFLDEVPDCLLDVAPPGDQVGNDNGECASMWEACAVGQGAFLHEVGHAFSAPHSSGIMLRGYSKDWPKCFLSKTSDSIHAGTKGIEPVTPDTPNNCHWDIRDMLSFSMLPHFQQPSDKKLSSNPPMFNADDEGDELSLILTCEAGIGQVLFDGKAEPTPTFASPQTEIRYTLKSLEARFKIHEKFDMEVIGMNGKYVVRNVLKQFSNKAYVRVPGSTMRLQKMSVGSENVQSSHWPWGVMLKKRSRNGSLVPVSKLDLRVGCVLDGVIAHYKDGSAVPCGPRGPSGKDVNMGGHQSRKIAIPKGVEITKVAVARRHNELVGIRVWLSNGKKMGALNKDGSDSVEVLTPSTNHRVIGFFGASETDGFQSISEFGIVSAPKDHEIPDSVYDIPELQNDRDGGARPSKRRKMEDSFTGDDDCSTSEDSDTGYDNDSDVDFE